MRTRAPRLVLSAALVTAVSLSFPTTTAFAASGSASGSGGSGAEQQAAGCVSDAEFGRLAVGQRLRFVRRVAGNDAQTSMRRWATGAYRYQERLYTMCTPRDKDHATLTTRFMHYNGAWRAYLVDTKVGPEDS